MSLSGTLSLYKTPGHEYPYFTSGDLTSPKAVVFIGGLFNGLLSPPYLVELSFALGKAGWRLVQMHWSGAYDGFGTGSLDRDRLEISCLVSRLREQGTEKVVLMGHSTGSQDVIHYLSASKSYLSPSSASLLEVLTKVDGGILQAPASDREFFVTPSSPPDPNSAFWLAQLPIATELVKSGRGEEVLDKDFCLKAGCRMSAYRLWSLLSDEGDDDYFSSGIPLDPDGVKAHPLSQSFGQISAPALALYSEKDEFGKLPDVRATMRSWEEAAGGKLEAKVLMGASHAVAEFEARNKLFEEVVGWLRRVIG